MDHNTKEEKDKRNTRSARRISKKKHKMRIFYIIIFITIAIIVIIGGTHAKYSGLSSGTGTIQVANWNIRINGESILANQNTITNDLNLIIDTSPMDGIIRNGDTGYFDIVINPTGTEVNSDYEINLSFLKSNVASTDMQFTHYSFDNGTNKTSLQNNTITGTFNINSLNSVTCRVYWEWTGNVSVNGANECEINANVNVSQKIS